MNTPFSKVLIANRGEIAVRIARACRELGILSVGVYSTADADALHVRTVDEAILIGSPSPSESYLNEEKIIQAALACGAQAVHPGYGFLSENATFAQTVREAGLVFIGPSADSIRRMGDKAGSKLSMQQAGVPTVPGAQGLESPEDFTRAAQQIGWPVLVKAAAGGGGKGMRIVEDPASMPEAVEGARREALNSFGDGRLLLEKFLPHAHHVEFQVFGDLHANLVHLFERECSVQRRHQKIIEETPSPLLTPELRGRMGEAALAAAQAVDYFNAGTVEFIVDPGTLDFFFLEMNTRLQVEHPVTELVAGIDLVQAQIRSASGEPFLFEQEHFSQRGHAIECRIYAEDPANGFLPSSGRLLRYIEPQGPGIRVDSGFEAGGEVSHYYDPLLAKLIVHAEDRPSAIRRMQAALRGFVVHGVVTNIDFLQDVLAHPDFEAGSVTTRWVETDFVPPAPGPVPEALIAASLAEFSTSEAAPAASTPGGDPFSPWKSGRGSL